MLSQGKEIHVRERIVRHEGSILDIVCHKQPLYNKYNKIVGVLGFSMAVPQVMPKVNISKREQQVLRLLAEGGTDKSIALCLNLSPRTIESHINNLKTKLQAKNRIELTSLSLAMKIL